MNTSAGTRILAIDVKSRLLGVAVFEPPVRLLDWSKRAISADACAALVTKLLQRYTVSTVVLRGVRRGEHRDTKRVRRGLRVIRAVARECSIPVVTLTERQVRMFFRKYQRYRRYDSAVFLSMIFPDLRWSLPHPRKFYEPENRRMALFDAVALGLAFLGTGSEGEAVCALLASAAGAFSPASR